MLPPNTSGGMVDSGPPAGATPMTPQNGARGSLMPGMNSIGPLGPSFVTWYAGFGNSSASSPKPGMIAVQPQLAGSNASRSTWSASPGSAPATAIGPTTW